MGFLAAGDDESSLSRSSPSPTAPASAVLSVVAVFSALPARRLGPQLGSINKIVVYTHVEIKSHIAEVQQIKVNNIYS